MIRKYAFINAKVKARRSRRLSEEFFRTAARTRSLPEAIQLFRDTPYPSLTTVYNETGDIRLVEKDLLSREIALYTDLIRFLPPDVRLFSESLFLRYEIDSLKFALRLWYAQCVRAKNITRMFGYFLPVSIRHDPDYRALINAPDEERVLEIIRNTPYGDLIREGLLRCRADKTLYPVEWALDRYYFRQLVESLSVLTRRDRSPAAGIISRLTDRQNLLTLLLFRRSSAFPDSTAGGSFLEGGETITRTFFEESLKMEDAVFREALHRLFPHLSFGVLNKALPQLFSEMEENIREISRKLAGGDPFSIGIILSWYLSGQDEFRKITRLLNEKFYESREV